MVSRIVYLNLPITAKSKKFGKKSWNIPKE